MLTCLRLSGNVMVRKEGFGQQYNGRGSFEVLLKLMVLANDDIELPKICKVSRERSTTETSRPTAIWSYRKHVHG